MENRPKRPKKQTIEKIGRISIGTVCGALWKIGFNNTYAVGIKSYVPGKKLVGTAITVRYIPLREDLLKKMPSHRSDWADFRALEMVEKGDVIVCDASHGGNSTFGEIMVTRLQARGGTGLVVDGEIRDTPVLRTMGVPVFASGIHASPGPKTILPIDVNVPIQCGRVAVTPGDVITADDDGVVVVPQEVADQVAELGLEEETLENFIIKQVRNTPIAEFYPPSERTKKAYQKWTGKM